MSKIIIGGLELSRLKYAIAKNEEEYAGVQELGEKVFSGEGVGDFLNEIYNKSPKKDQNICFYAFDEEKKKYAGTLNLIDTPIRYGDIVLKACEYGVAGTAENYRFQGVNRKLTELFFQQCKERGYNLVVLEGIPYFYRQYGFNYAVPMKFEKLNLQDLELKVDEKIQIRKAQPSDFDYLIKNYQHAAEAAEFCKFLEPSILKTQLFHYRNLMSARRYYIIESDGQKIGYFGLNINDDIKIIDIADQLGFSCYESVLRFLQIEFSLDNLTVDIPEQSKFIKFIRMFGSKRVGRYAWQIRILDELKFLQDILPILEKRLNESVFKDEKIEFCYNNFKRLIRFQINQGKITLSEEKWRPYWEFNLSPQGAVKLFIGHNTREEIMNFLPDCYVDIKYQEIIDILFPKMVHHFYVNY